MRTFKCITLWLAVFVTPTVAGQFNPIDTTADAVLGQFDFASQVFNAPIGVPSGVGLSLSNAADVAIAPSGRLFVSDAENNRVLSWPSAAAFSNAAPADLVLGQPDFASTAPNAGGSVSASGFWLPQGLFVDDAEALWVCDAFNSRVLRFDNPATTDGIADLVIGQPNFTSGLPNLGGGFEDQGVATADSILFPGRVVVNWPSVFVADSGNSRVLHYTAPMANKPFADRVWGQYGDFRQRAKNNNGVGQDSCCPTDDTLFNPIGIALDAAGSLWVADWQNHRIVRFDDALTSDTTADGVVGQTNFVNSDPDVFGSGTGLQLPIDVEFDARGRLWIADAGNNRIILLRLPLSGRTNRALGQPDGLFAQQPNHGLGPFAADAVGLFGPTAIAFTAQGDAIIADTNNTRVLRFHAIATPRTWPAESVPLRATLP
ncbi:MAG: NHL repeat-containing protein [Phycisphaerae bacterium]